MTATTTARHTRGSVFTRRQGVNIEPPLTLARLLVAKVLRHSLPATVHMTR